jgi:hypothetical protein
MKGRTGWRTPELHQPSTFAVRCLARQAPVAVRCLGFTKHGTSTSHLRLAVLEEPHRSEEARLRNYHPVALRSTRHHGS